ncbi:single-stranded-DNA-specific exonuclease RecJ [Mesonia sp. HuA40]|uniref:single-stranded-DNA-specific exonuclease RecJ n=1 Tax=Mesonia sp. HuA40 TaxID=2602761 RepID=UPI0011C9D20B|nr:single-stranded-DNA-specific exonuclease RecJ [Mesonia sp. HuA40]TXK72652.1 single-stranded-DNA-specific exonuclease RecJ [Mesonia sp. HuA40]
MRWTLKPIPDIDKVKQLQEALQVDQNIATLLVQRGIENFEQAKAFFRPSLADLHDPFLMQDMDIAVNRIEQAIKLNQRILVYGDYDVDGTTSVALMSSYLRNYTENVVCYIPDRYKEGYGISYQGINFAHDNEFDLIIALDCGIKAVDKVDYAQKKGLDFIICDHHRPGPEIPKAAAVLNPKRPDCNYPYKELCGCGVGFKLIQALEKNQGRGIEFLTPYLDLVATAIGADIVPITGENRILAYYGLQVINSSPRVGFQAIIKEINKKNLSITDVVFIIAPRINAAGRMEHALRAVDLMLTTDPKEAQEMAQAIDRFNQDRRETDKKITQEALSQIKSLKEEERTTTVVYQKNWHKGVIGIVASRLTETYYRPTLVFTKSGEKLAASARSVNGFDLYAALEACQDFIEQFGGHKYAAGLTLKEENYSLFKQKFEQVVQQQINPKLLEPEINIDLKLDFKSVTPKFYRILSQFAPFGPGNPAPIFMTENLKENGFSKQVGADKNHLKCSLNQRGSTYIFSGIGFNLGKYHHNLRKAKSCSAVYSLEENEWNGQTTLQLKLRDLDFRN